MEFITASQAAEKWGVSPRRVQILCNNGRVKGAYKFGKQWMIPSTAILPSTAKANDDFYQTIYLYKRVILTSRYTFITWFLLIEISLIKRKNRNFGYFFYTNGEIILILFYFRWQSPLFYLSKFPSHRNSHLSI